MDEIALTVLKLCAVLLHVDVLKYFSLHSN